MLVPEALFPQERIIVPRALVRRVRELQGTGQVLASQGSEVEPADIIAETQESGEIHVLDAARALGVAPRKVEGMLAVAIGEQVSAGQLLARRGGLLRRSLHAPADGILSLLDERGFLLIQSLPRRRQLQALMRGTVVAVAPGESVTIEGAGALLQGAWGNDREAAGLLRMMVGRPDELLPSALINAGVRGTILVVGPAIDHVGLENARLVEARGLIVGGLDASLLPVARRMPYPILVTEGFGFHPISQPIFDLLKSSDGREATLTPVTGTSRGRSRAELFVPVSGSAAAPQPAGPLAENDRVIVRSEPFLGKFGTVVSSRGERLSLPTGQEATGCQILLDEGRALLLPYANLERLVT